MYLPSLNELNKSAVQQKVIDQSDERVQRNAMQSRPILGQNKQLSDYNSNNGVYTINDDS